MSEDLVREKQLEVDRLQKLHDDYLRSSRELESEMEIALAMSEKKREYAEAKVTQLQTEVEMLKMANHELKNALNRLKPSLKSDSVSKLPILKREILLSPKFILSSLTGVVHRFFLIQESEVEINANVAVVSRFTVGGPRGGKDPRTVSPNQLIPISNLNPEIHLPAGWAVLHPYMYCVQASTDEHGWQYRSDWSDGMVSPHEEQWVERYDSSAHHVRRRLWLTTVVKKNDFLRAKQLLFARMKSSHPILQGELTVALTRNEAGQLQWLPDCLVTLHFSRIEYHTGVVKQREHPLQGCALYPLPAVLAGEQGHAFCLRNSTGNVAIYFRASSGEERSLWTQAIQYQLAVTTPFLNFPPLAQGPPTGEPKKHRLLLCGDLEMWSPSASTWIACTAEMRVTDLRCYKGVILLGCVHLLNASVTVEPTAEFHIKSASGLQMRLRAASVDVRQTWAAVLQEHIVYLNRKAGKTRHIPAEELEYLSAMTPRMHRELYSLPAWRSPVGTGCDEEADAAYLQNIEKEDDVKEI